MGSDYADLPTYYALTDFCNPRWSERRSAYSATWKSWKVAVAPLHSPGNRASALTGKLISMLDVLIFIAGTGLWLFGLIDCAKTDQDAARTLPKWAWLIIVILFGTFGSLAWLLAGRPKKVAVARNRPGRVLPPDDNPDFLKNL